MGKRLTLSGIMPAMITPFTSDGRVDTAAIARGIERVAKAGVSGVVYNGSTGEAVALTRDERKAVLSAAREAAGERLKLIAGTGAPTTGEALLYTRDAKECGADAALIITPFDAIPNKEGLYRHYATLCEAGLPIILYNIPQHTGVTLGLETVERLADVENVVGIKDSSGDLSFFSELVRRFGDRLSILTGCDDLLFQAFMSGASGAILALAGIAPKEVVALFEACRAGRADEAKTLYYKILPIARAISASINFPAQVKEAMRLLGEPAGDPRLPIIPVSEEESRAIRSALSDAGLL
ncbi:MAG TPA: 4-hydroxy-tetrahydrodipicolinate synthase [Clostridia bacterium]|nr:4-hydroxy-tetrahydrodipicolinate synthase [Clostridia bacterium]